MLDGENWWDQTPGLWNWWNASLPAYDPGNVNNVEWYGMACTPACLLQCIAQWRTPYLSGIFPEYIYIYTPE